GIIGMTILFSATFTGIEVIWDRQFGFLKEMLVSPVPRINIMVGRTIGGATVAVFQGLIVLVIAMLFGFQVANLWMLPVAILAMFIIALLFTALGTALASTMQDMQAFQLIINFLLMPLFFLSGALFPMSGLPEPLGLIVKLNPLTYGVDALRGTLSGTAQFGLGLDFLVLIVVSAIFLFIGSYFFSKMQL
ncbi:MAG: ABC transporter permease, partial [archaeon]